MTLISFLCSMESHTSSTQDSVCTLGMDSKQSLWGALLYALIFRMSGRLRIIFSLWQITARISNNDELVQPREECAGSEQIQNSTLPLLQ